MKPKILFWSFLALSTTAFTQTKSNDSAVQGSAAGVRYRDEVFSSYTKTSDLVYGQAVNVANGLMETLKLDIYEPSGDSEPKRAVIVWVHAGGFTRGDKTDQIVIDRCTAFTRRGYVTVANNYRLHGNHEEDGPAAAQQAMEDTKAAIRWLRANAATYRIDVNRISVGGSSSGGITAVLTTYEESEGSSGNPGYSSEVSACLEGSGKGDSAHVDLGEAPLLIVHGDEDVNVLYNEALMLEAKAIQVGIPYEFHTLVGEDHSWTDQERADFILWASNFNYKYVIQTGPNGPPAVTIDDVSVTEGNSGTANAVFTLHLSEPTANGQVVTFEYATANNSATAGSDYVAKSGTFSFPAGTTTQTLSVSVNGDGENEPDEIFHLNLKKPDNARINDLRGLGTILNDDLAGAPAAPNALVATANGTSTINLSWNDNAGNEDGFRIERKTGSSAFAQIGSVGPNVESFADQGLAAATTYTYRVRAYNNVANSGYSNEASATTSCNVAADFSANVTSGCASLNVAFSDLSSGQVVSWSWDFGDGSTATTQHPTHTYATAGTYTVKLTAGSTQCSDVETKSGYITVSGVPTVAFVGSPLSGNAPLTVNFTDQSTGSPTSWTWEFGDNTTSTQKNPSHQYTAPGQYTVKLTASNSCGSNTLTKTNYINVTNNTSANLALNKPATASSTNGSYAATRAVDGSTSSYWRSGSVSSSAPVAWLRVDLGSPQTVGRAVVRWNSSYYAKQYDFQVSTDDVNWTTVYTNNSGTSGVNDFTFSQTTARYVRLYMRQNKKSNYRITELEAYVSSAGAIAANDDFTFEAMDKPDDELESEPAGIELLPAYPNPFNPSTTIAFRLPAAAQVRIRVYNMLGETMETLVDGMREAGKHEVIFSAAHLPSGSYFVVLEAEETRLVQRLLLVK